MVVLKGEVLPRKLFRSSLLDRVLLAGFGQAAIEHCQMMWGEQRRRVNLRKEVAVDFEALLSCTVGMITT